MLESMARVDKNSDSCHQSSGPSPTSALEVLCGISTLLSPEAERTPHSKGTKLPLGFQMVISLTCGKMKPI